MGNSNSDGKKEGETKKKDKGEGGSGDGFFGNFKWRIFVIGILLIVFAALQLPLISDSLDTYSQLKDLCHDFCDITPFGADACDDNCNDAYSDVLAALSLIEIGLLLMIIGSVCAIVINLVNCNDCCGSCDNCLLMFIMIALIGGGLFYLVGTWYWIGETSGGLTALFGILGGASGCDLDPDTALDMIELISVAESFLGGVTAIVFGVDCWKQILNDHKKRMYAQSVVLLIIVSFLCLIGYGYFGSNCDDGVDETRLIAAGYFFIMLSCILYLVTSLVDCGNKIQQMCSQIIIAILLIVGAVLTGIGYWGNTYPDVDGAEEYNSFVTGYVFLLVGLCVVNALDMGLYDNAKAAKTASSTKK